MCERYEEMGMTDKQFKGYLREIIDDLEEIQEQVEENKKLERMIERLQKALED